MLFDPKCPNTGERCSFLSITRGVPNDIKSDIFETARENESLCEETNGCGAAEHFTNEELRLLADAINPVTTIKEVLNLFRGKKGNNG